MKIIFFGTPLFAAKVLQSLIEKNIEIVAVVSKPDKPQGRSSKLIPTPVKEVALKYSIPCFQPEKVSGSEFIDVLPQFHPDLFVVVAYGEIIKQHILDIPKKGSINLHASLLPKYRGAAPIQRAIIDGEKETGVSIIYLVKKMDAGDILATESTPISSEDTYETVSERLCEIGTRLTLKVIAEIENGSQHRITQDESKVTYAHKLELEDCEINWNESAESIHNLVRGVNPFPGAWSYIFIGEEKKRLKIFVTEVLKGEDAPAFCELRYDKGLGLIVGCGQGGLVLKELQVEGKKRVSSHELLRGVNFKNIRFK